ncbi:MAG: hypothetical protein L0Y44_09260 [Phycisphaerales bacterium]|nr:hypothetical protein [Phycisphaerales bacterium]MCI0630826.1 hypothetical protein [Phycisphaerales bacterium]MCI0674468.1 hypothetical protein [Phycisphaerales bacterium]
MTVVIEPTPWGKCRRYYDERNTIVFAEYLMAAMPDQRHIEGVHALAQSGATAGGRVGNGMIARFA